MSSRKAFHRYEGYGACSQREMQQPEQLLDCNLLPWPVFRLLAMQVVHTKAYAGYRLQAAVCECPQQAKSTSPGLSSLLTPTAPWLLSLLQLPFLPLSLFP